MTSAQVDVQPIRRGLRGDVLCVPLAAPQRRPRFDGMRGFDEATIACVRALVAAYAGRGDAGAIDVTLAPPRTPFRRVMLCCLGRSNRPSRDDVASAAAAGARWCATQRQSRLVVAMEPLLRAAGPGAAAAWAEATVMAGFRFDRLRSPSAENEETVGPLRRLTLAAPSVSAPLRRRVAEAVVAAEAVNLARAYGHEPPNVINPVTLAQRARAEARRVGLRCTVLDHRRLAALKMQAMLAVGRGSATPPRLIVLEHRGRQPGAPPIVLVGKAITLDTGGYSIKPYESIPEMKYDKCGGMAVLAALVAAARLKIAARVVGIIAAAENMIDSHAYRPGDILTAMNGKTIEILSTDAEGRLVLADALTYAQRTFKPRALIDLATLTGACVVALGNHAAGLFSNDDALAARLTRAADDSGDRVWRMPLWPAYRKQIKGTDSDLKNSGGRPAGSVTAAVFLKEFVEEKTPWAHLDIAGVAYSDKDAPLCPRGATGFGVRLLLRYLTERGN